MWRDDGHLSNPESGDEALLCDYTCGMGIGYIAGYTHRIFSGKLVGLQSSEPTHVEEHGCLESMPEHDANMFRHGNQKSFGKCVTLR